MNNPDVNANPQTPNASATCPGSASQAPTTNQPEQHDGEWKKPMNTPDVIEQPAAPTPVACSDLLSCPFCRNQNISVEWEKCDRISSDDTDRLWWCECRYCGSHGPCANTEPEAKHRWQTRAHEFNTPIWEQRKRNPLGQDEKGQP